MFNGNSFYLWKMGISKHEEIRYGSPNFTSITISWENKIVLSLPPYRGYRISMAFPMLGKVTLVIVLLRNILKPIIKTNVNFSNTSSYMQTSSKDAISQIFGVMIDLPGPEWCLTYPIIIHQVTVVVSSECIWAEYSILEVTQTNITTYNPPHKRLILSFYTS